MRMDAVGWLMKWLGWSLVLGALMGGRPWGFPENGAYLMDELRILQREGSKGEFR